MSENQLAPLKDVVRRQTRQKTEVPKQCLQYNGKTLCLQWSYETELSLSCGHKVVRPDGREGNVKRVRCGECLQKRLAAQFDAEVLLATPAREAFIAEAMSGETRTEPSQTTLGRIYERIQELQHQKQALLDAIHDGAKRCHIANDIPPDGPNAILFCQNMADENVKLRTERDALLRDKPPARLWYNIDRRVDEKMGCFLQSVARIANEQMADWNVDAVDDKLILRHVSADW